MSLEHLDNVTKTLSPYQEIIDVEHYVIERHNQVELFAETVKFDAEQMLKQCRQRIEKHHFLTEYECKTKEVTMQRAREKLGAFFTWLKNDNIWLKYQRPTP